MASGGHSSSRCAGVSLSRPLLLWSTGSRRAVSVVVAHGPSCSAACGILPDQGTNLCPPHWRADSQPLRHQGSPSLLHSVEGVFGPGHSWYHPVWLCTRRWTLLFWGYSFLWGERESGLWGDGWGTGREVFSAQVLRSLSIGASCLGEWWEMPASYSWGFGPPGSLGSEVGVWLFFLKGGIVPASC